MGMDCGCEDCEPTPRNIRAEPTEPGKFNVIADSIPARFLLSVIADEANKATDRVRAAGNGPIVEVQLLVNGMPMDFRNVIERWWKSCKDDIENDARKMAVKMVTEAGLDPIADALRDAEQRIRGALDIWDHDTYR